MNIYTQKLKDDLARVKSASLSQSMKPEMVALRNEVMDVTHWMTEGTPIAARVKAILQDLVEIPDCMCGNKCGLDKSYTNVFQKFCSAECNQTYSRLSPDAAKKLYDYDWLYEQRYTLKKSKDQIAEEIGTSHIAVSNAIKRFDMVPVRYNETSSDVKAKLMDKELLQRLYDTGMTWEEVAKEIGCDQSTLVVYANKHGIISRNPNSYEREKNYVSQEENDIADFIATIYGGEIRRSVRNITGNCLELDIYLPELQIGFEYNGLYYHKHDPNGTTPGEIKDETYHVGKTDYAKSNGVTLIHIFSDMWKYKPEIVKSLIRAKLGKLENKIYARQCQIINADHAAKRVFLSENHMMGNDKSSINYSLVKDGVIVAMMTFGKSRFSKKHKWELIRFCVKQNTSVVGGFTRLLNAFRTNYDGSIVSYADYSVSDGSVYEKNGFAFVRKNKPTGWGFNSNKSIRINRMQLTKKKIENALGISTTYTEKQLRQLLNIPTIFDCGTLTYEIL